MDDPRIRCVILDWAGTAVDYGCFAPLHAFLDIFRRRGVEPTEAEVREPMGLPKRDHVRALCQMPRLARAWADRFGREPDEADGDALYADFEPALFATLADHADPLPGVTDTVAELRRRGIAVGSTTGYTADMMEVVAAGARARGYAPDLLITPDQVAAGRPAPWMIYRACEALGVWPLASVVKVGDTQADIAEGLNASAWSVGVVEGSSELGLSREAFGSLDPAGRTARTARVRERFLAAGAHAVIDRLDQLPDLIDRIQAARAPGPVVLPTPPQPETA